MTHSPSPFRRKIFLSYLLILLVMFAVVMPLFFLYLNENTESREMDTLNSLCERTVAQLDDRISQLNNLSIYVSTLPQISSLIGNKSDSTPQSRLNDFTGMLWTLNVPADNSRQRICIYNDVGYFKSAGYAVSAQYVRERMQTNAFRDWYAGLDGLSGYQVLAPHSDFWYSDTRYEPVSLVRNLVDPATFKRIGMVEIQLPYDSLLRIITLEAGVKADALLVDDLGNVLYTTLEGLEYGPVAVMADAGETDASEGDTDASGSGATDASGASNTHASDAGVTAAASSGMLPASWLQSTFSLEDGRMPALEPFDRDLVVGRVSGRTGWHFYLLTSSRILGRSTFWVYALMILIMLIIMAVMAVITYMVARRVVQPLATLSDQVRQVSFQNLAINLPESNEHDEIGQLNDAFNGMFLRLRESMDENASMRTRELQAHLVALQSQIDPHFLYNILSIISAYSRETGIEAVGDISARLSAIIRYATRHDDSLVTLDQEIAHVRNYLTLMKLRYEEQFSYDIDLPDDIPVHRIRLPRLSLQPLVENSFSHGFKQVLPPWRLQVQVRCEDSSWTLLVDENGAGMRREQIQSLEAQLALFMKNPSDSIRGLKLGGMGLINTLARLKFLYREQFRFSIKSVDDGISGFRITIGGVLAEDQEDTI